MVQMARYCIVILKEKLGTLWRPRLEACNSWRAKAGWEGSAWNVSNAALAARWIAGGRRSKFWRNSQVRTFLFAEDIEIGGPPLAMGIDRAIL
jgi:hypothetical protein